MSSSYVSIAAKPQTAHRLAELRAPTLVLVGELDIPDFQIITEVLAGNIAGARLRVIADSGHVPPLEQPQAFNEALLQFLNRLL